jgi:anion-transporting  ArsA/GET3 family ATPase
VYFTNRKTAPSLFFHQNRQLEQQYDAEAGEERQPLSGEELDPDKLMREVEDFLRKQREGRTGT